MTDNLPAPPYPSDIRAKGWRFELDHERIEESDTWALAAEIPFAQACLVLMWLLAWRQEPCGSLPDDEQVIRAKLRIPAAQWPKLRPVLMRGWWKASDGRLYHSTLTKRVAEMLSKRRSDADRQASKRMREAAESALSHAGVGPESRVTHAGVGSESSTDNRPPNTEEQKHPPTPRKRGQVSQFPPGFDRFWAAYPRHEAKAKAAQAFARIRPDEALLGVMLAAIQRQRDSEQWRRDGGVYIPHPTTWLNGRRWEDETPTAAAGAAVRKVDALMAGNIAAAQRYLESIGEKP